ncbi:hypothetical protein JCM19237_3166 [Photobacterium aphoticum]|uniref:Uncharacterized protein n=1 Tax=Photobacterium aphoticum TaxID=754436 RepID=A0A090RMG1_9GAMM|nr:hypothetical protein JCM19237_3166 [Photobacterium aphoticum]
MCSVLLCYGEGMTVTLMIYLIQACIYFGAGFLWKLQSENRALLFVVFCGVLLPYTASFQSYYYQSGVSVFDLFFVGAALGYLLTELKLNTFTLSKLEIIISSSILLVVFMYMLISLLKYEINFVHYIKDIKPILFISLMYFFCRSDGRRIFDFGLVNNTTFSMLKTISTLVILKNSLFYMLFLFLGMSYFYTGNVYLDSTDSSVRYADYANLFFVLLLVNLLFIETKCKSKKEYRDYCFILIISTLASLLISLYSGSRTFILINLFVVVMRILCSRNSFFVFCVSVPIIIISCGLINFDLDIGRFEDLLSFDRLQNLLYNRFYPVLVMYDDGLQLSKFLFGHGLGTSFYIPWMKGVGDLSPYQVYIDNFVLTLFAKYGIFGVLSVLVVFLNVFYRFTTTLAQFLTLSGVFFCYR